MWSTSGYDRTNFKFYGNVIYNSSSDGVILSDPTDGECKNNIIYCDSVANEAYEIGAVKGGGSWVSDYNLIGPEGTDYIYYVDTNYSTLAAYVAAKSQDANSIKDDPLVTNAGSNDYTLQSTSPCINQGVNLGTTYKDALDPSSTWPSGVVTGDQNRYGQWEIGAYFNTFMVSHGRKHYYYYHYFD
jgi:hypothetical protein